ncbi:hypothetical protein BHM03_00000323 [Ensete ventricosum]|nr:hypothetical protein BHM03_00000323 [Ensete ventricosum]
MKSTSRKQPKEAVKEGIVDNRCKEATNDSKKQHLTKSLKRSERSAMDVLPKHDNRYRCGSQAADVSGVTSAKDPTSARTDKLKQPIPCKGRKELINFLHEAMQTPGAKEEAVPTCHRKRVAAPLGKMERKPVIPTPMPLQYGGNPVAGSGTCSNKKLREWCVLNTKRPDFLEVIPRSLFDLVDKCLTVNPRRRITAEEALMHDFFAACHESLRQQRKLRREAFALESGTPFAAAV